VGIIVNDWHISEKDPLYLKVSPKLKVRLKGNTPITHVQELNMSRVSLNTPAPEFNLKDFRGNNFSLSEYRNKKNLILVFNRGFT
jgi:hypothetical protein